MKFIHRNHIALGIGLWSLSATLGINSPVQAAPRNKENHRAEKQARKDEKRADKAARKAERRQSPRQQRDDDFDRDDVRDGHRNNRPYRENRPGRGNTNDYGYGNNDYGYENNGYDYGSNRPSSDESDMDDADFGGSMNDGYSQNDFRQFNGYVLGTSPNGAIRVRAQNGTIYTVQSSNGASIGQRVRVAGYLHNGAIVDARVTRY